MPDYQIQAPDGNTYKISGPPNASRDEIIAHVTAQYPQAVKPKEAAGPSALGIAKTAGKVAMDVGGGLLNPKELVREAYHSVTDWAGHTIKAADDLVDWVGDKTGLRKAVGEKVWTGGDVDKHIADALLSEKLIREPQTVTGNIIKDIGEFTLGMATAGKVFNIANKTVQGGIAAGAAFDPQQGRLSDLIQRYPNLRNPVTALLQSKDDDSPMVARAKSAIEGLLGGVVAEGFVRSLNVLRSAMGTKVAKEAFEVAPGTEAVEKPGGLPVPATPSPAAAAPKPSSTSTASSSRDKVKEGLDKLLTRAAMRQAMEDQGRSILEEIDEKGITSNQVAKKFWNETYWKLGASTQRRFRDELENHTGLANGTLEKEPERLHDAIQNRMDLPDKIEHLEGTDRGFVSMMQWANEQAAKAPEGGIKSTGIDARTGKPRLRLIEQGQQEAKAEIAGQAAAGKTPDLGEGVSKSTEAVEKETHGPKPATPSMTLEQAFSPAPLAARATGKLSEWWKWTQQLVAPGSVSKEAKQAEADIASAYAEHTQHTEELYHRSPQRREYFEVNPKKVPDFVRQFESGKPMKDPTLEQARTFYKSWMDKTMAAEKAAGITYEAESHYIPHLFENEAGVQDWLKSKGVKEPGFTKERTFDLYEQAVKAGFKPRFINPEDIFHARQHASDMAMARVTAMEHLERDGLAIAGKEGRPGFRTSYAAPNGKTYWVHDDAKLLLNRMFDERSLWTVRSPIGSMYRGMVALKNNLIPVRLAFSLFHPLHVMTMHVLATAATRSWKAGEWMPSKYTEGSRMLSILRGEIPNEKLSTIDKENLQYVGEGGLILEQDPRYRTQALDRLRTEFQKGNPGALLHLHTGALQAIQNVVFKTWIPSLKGASYLADVRAALKAKPNLVDDSAARRVALRRIAKSVENRYGEMNYSTLFWNRMFRDVGVLSATSMGWQMGLFREYGGGAGQLAGALGKMAVNPRNARQIYQALKSSGNLDKLVYIANYSTIAGVLGGLVTWGMTGQKPTGVMDFFAPRTGEQNPDGTPARVRTMFYPYEFAAMEKRIEHQGPSKAAAEWLSSKGSGLPSMLSETWTGIDGLGRDIRDPDHPFMQQVRETVEAVMKENYPISLQDRGGPPESAKQKILNVAGMTRAPKYLQETSGEAQIDDLWSRYYRAAETPFQQGVRSDMRKQLQQQVTAGDDTGSNATLTKMAEKFNLRSQDAKRLVRDAAQGVTSHQALFREMREDDQRKVLRKMSPEEREKYLPYAKHRVMAEFSE
jgi:hypothetical protein